MEWLDFPMEIIVRMIVAYNAGKDRKQPEKGMPPSIDDDSIIKMLEAQEAMNGLKS